MRYERFYIVDENIIINTTQINELFDIADTYYLSICQPAFNPKYKISHKITIAEPNSLLRYTNFVEFTTPLFSKEALINFMKVYDDSLKGWGIDYLYIWANGIDKKNRYAIIDKIICIKPIDNKQSSLINSVAYQAKIWYDYSMKLGAPYDWTHRTYDILPLTIVNNNTLPVG